MADVAGVEAVLQFIEYGNFYGCRTNIDADM